MLTQAQKDALLSRDLEDFKKPHVQELFSSDERFKQCILDVCEESDQFTRERLLMRIAFFINAERRDKRDAISEGKLHSALFEITPIKEALCTFSYDNKIFYARNVKLDLWKGNSEEKANLLKTLILEDKLINFKSDERYQWFDKKIMKLARDLRKSEDLIDE